MNQGGAGEARRHEAAGPGRGDPSEQPDTASQGGAGEARRHEAAGPGRGDPSEQPDTVNQGGADNTRRHEGPGLHGSETPRSNTEPKHSLRYVARSDRGLIRATNQDSVFAGNRLLVIADGMGGHAAGDTASRLVVAAFAPLNDHDPAPDLLSDLVGAAREGNDAIAEMVAENPELDGMGTTVTAMLFDGDRVGMAHVGDSRAYLYRSGMLHQLTHDDTFVQSLVDDGRITEDEAAHHPQRNLLLRALNGTDLDPFLALREVRPGDRYLLCSDGLSGVVGAEPIADTLADPDPERAADVLIQRALLRGGPDNVTVIVADVIDTGVVPTPGPVTVPAAGPEDPDATGPIQQMTREMPRVPLPPIPEEPAVPADLVAAEDGYEDGDFDEDGDDREDDFEDDEDFDGGDGQGGDGDDDRPGAPGGAAAAATIGTIGTVGAAGTRRPPERRSRRRRWHRRGALTVAIVALLLVALAGSTLWVRSQYYVGAQNDLVAVFRGVNGSLLGFHFSSFQETSCEDKTGCTPIRVSDLQQAARNQVLAGISATSLADARGVMDRLSGQLLPPCTQQSTTNTVPGTVGSGTGASSAAGSSTGSGVFESDQPPASSPGGAVGGAGPSTTVQSTSAMTTPRAGSGTPTTRSGRTTAGTHPNTGKQTSRNKAGTKQTTKQTAKQTAKQTLQQTAKGTSTGARGGADTRTTGTSQATAQAAAAPPVVTLQPAPTTLTVQVTVTPDPAGLRAAIQRALNAPDPGTHTPGTGRTTRTTRTAASTNLDQTTGAGRSGTTSTAPVSTVTASTPTVTVTHTVTAGPTTSGTPLAPAPAVPGVTCRVVG